MMDNIIRRIRQYYPVSDASIEKLRAIAAVHRLPRKHLLIESGCRCGHAYFIEEGMCRTFCMIKGTELTSWFSREGDFTFALNELYFGEPGFESVELLEDCLLYAVPITDFVALQQQDLDLCNWSRICHQYHVNSMQCARIDRLSLSAEERYHKLIAQQPDLLQRVSLGYIASYLGMTAQSLSRLRAKVGRNEK